MTRNGLLQRTRDIKGSRVALSDGEREITYAQLQPLVEAEIRWLHSGGKRIALLADNGCSWALTDLALHEARIVNVPLPAYFTPQQLRHAVRDAGVDSIVTDRPDYALELWPELAVVGASKITALTLLRRTVPDSRIALPAATIKVTYTSGSTAEPKGVCLSASALESVAHSLADIATSLGISRHLCLLPLPTLLENLAGVYASLLAGATCITPPASVTGMHYSALDAVKLLSTISRTQPESLILVPELLRLLVHAASEGWSVPRSLKFIAVGGATVSPVLLEQAMALRLPVFQGYGLSECASVVCLNTPAENRMGSVGKPLPHCQVRTDGHGQLHVRGATMDGYLGGESPKYSDELATGDLGEIDADGFVYIKGRIRNIIITSVGRNISPEWVERELTQESAIRHAIVLGEARPYPVALLFTSRADIEPAVIEQAVARANSRLPDYARVVRWALLPEAPTLTNEMLTSNGRLRRERIIARYPKLIDQLYEAKEMAGTP